MSDAIQIQQQSQIADLQEKIAFLEDALTKLSDEYFMQQKELQQLSVTVDALIDKLRRSEESGDKTETLIDERPPHY